MNVKNSKYFDTKILERGTYRHDELYSSYILELADGTKAWIPIVSESLKPILHSCFDTLD
ncbi:hypothetical protein OSB04_023887 [Centaurea solstitialis]|uniref:Uncharacterized protein n=1 Tax=Centaurea solstitialis TaxID=347529 RepID=A0AA38SXF9_9ASTR|nr:hypothetical protein OSB04_023887 [Centaurea solstitialis]